MILGIFAVLVLAGCASGGSSTTPTTATTTGAAPSPSATESSAPSGVIVQGHIEPRQFADLAFSIPGQVTEVLVSEGQTVSAGQPLARLAGSETRLAALAQAQQEALAAQQALDSLSLNAQAAYAQALQTQADAQTALEDAQKKRNYLNYVRGTPGSIAAANAGYILAQDQVNRLQETYDNVAGRPEDDSSRALAIANLENAKKARDKALVNLNYYKSKPTAQDIANADANLAKAQADLQLAQDKVSKLQSGTDPDETAAAQARIQTAKAGLASAQAALDSLELKAPLAGTVSVLSLKVGEFVQAGQSGVTVADFSAWIVKTDDLTELEVVKIQDGQAVSFILDALPGQPAAGKVSEISSRFEEKRGDVTYTVRISLDQASPKARWGMIGQVQFEQGK
jgi:multidrug efflux pump subunit AcrA (membrane-fusion protein)